MMPFVNAIFVVETKAKHVLFDLPWQNTLHTELDALIMCSNAFPHSGQCSKSNLGYAAKKKQKGFWL